MFRLISGLRLSALALTSAALLASCSDSSTPTTASPLDAVSPSLAISVGSSNFQQCANGGDGTDTCVYINGVLNDSKSLYHESDVIAQRFVIPGLTPGHTYRLAFDYGWEKALNPGHMNYDFIAGWNVTLGTLANPCGAPLGNGSADIRNVCNTDFTVKATHSGANAAFQVIPDAIFTTNAPLGLGAELQAAIDRFQTVRGANAARFDILGGSFPAGAFDNVTYVVNGDDVTAQFIVRFTATQSTVMLLWGGHFADSRDYRLALWDDDKNGGTAEHQGNLTGAAGQSGAPFHFSQQYIKNLNSGDSTGIGSLSNNVQGSVLEAVPKANISIAAAATNGIGESHTFTVTLRKDLDAGAGEVPAAGEHVDVTLTPAGGAVVSLNAAASTCDNAGANTDANGQCIVVFTSNAAGTITGSATSTLSLNGTPITVSTDGSGSNSTTVVKTFVAGAIRWLKHDGSGQLLGGAVFTVCRTHAWDSDLNSGAGGYTDVNPDVCFDVTDNVSGSDNTNAPPADRDGTAGEFEIGALIIGKYTVTEKTAPAGYVLDGDTENVVLSTTTTSATISTAFVNVSPSANIAIATAATNGIGEAHTFTVTLRKDLDDGAGEVPAAGEHVSVTLTPAGGAVVSLNAAASTCDDAGANTDANGQCIVVFTSSAAGTITGSATATLLLSGTSVTVSTDGSGSNSSSVIKTFVAGTIKWLKRDGNGQLLGGAVFTVCRTHDWGSDLNGGAGGYSDITPDVCIDVTDNVSGANNTNAPPADRDGTAGEFELGGLVIGKYTVNEKTAPAGYLLDADTENADLTTTNPSVTIATAFVDLNPDAFITIGPASATNDVTQSHLFTATMTAIPNGGAPVAIPDFTISVNPTPSTPGTTTCDAFDAATNSKTCRRTINSTAAGTFTANASATTTVAGITLTRDTDPATANIGAGPNGSGPAVKTYVAPNLAITKTPDQQGDAGYLVSPLGTATFSITVTNTGSGAATNVVVKDTLPNSGLTWTESNGSCMIAVEDIDPGVPVVNRQVLTCTLATLAAVTGSFTVAVSATVPASYIQVPPSPAGTPLQIDGNLDDDGAGNDWANVGIVCQTSGCRIDDLSGQNDGSFGQGTSEDTPVPSVVSGGVPPEKSDLLRFYIATERFVSNDHLYLAWERVQEPNGTTNMDFELNQSTALSSNGVTPVRTAGDLLIKYDLAKGGDVPVLGFHRWVTAASAGGQSAANACQASNKFPCWGKGQVLTTNVAGAINTVSVTDPINPLAPRTLDARTFGEARIDLQGAGIFQSGVCRNFGRAYLKSRSSDSFTAAVKDFIAPVPISINSCQDVLIDNRAWVSAANFTPTGGSLGGGISDAGQIKVQAPTSSTGAATNLQLALASSVPADVVTFLSVASAHGFDVELGAAGQPDRQLQRDSLEPRAGAVPMFELPLQRHAAEELHTGKVDSGGEPGGGGRNLTRARIR